MNLLYANDRQGEYPESYYAATAEPLEKFNCAQGDIRCDVCVVGGGFTGLSTAYHLANRGYDVVLLEAQRVGFGASGRNGGQVGNGQRVDQDDLEAKLGREHAGALWKIADQSVELVRKLCATPEVNMPFHQGVVHASHRKRYVAEYLDYAKKLNEQ